MSQPPPGPGQPDGERTTRLPAVPPPGYRPPPSAGPAGQRPPAPPPRGQRPAPPPGYAPQPGHQPPPGQPGPADRSGQQRNPRRGLAPPTPGTHQGWRVLLFATAVLVALVALAMLLLALFDHTTVTETTTSTSKTTSTRTAPTFAMAGAVGAAALVLVLCAAFFERITKIHFGGMEFDLDSVKAAVKASEAAGGDEATRSTNVKRALAGLAVAEPGERARLIAEPTQLAAELAAPPPS